VVENSHTGLYVVLAIVTFAILLALAYALSGAPHENASNQNNPPVTRTQ
jgi:hypothetical protein